MKSLKYLTPLFVLMSVLGLSACDSDGPVEEAGEEIDEAADEAEDEFDKAN